MAELLPLAPGVHYLPGAVNSLVAEDGAGGALLIDTGLDESHARKLLRALEGQGLTPRAILNTHSHADHIGGNAFLLSRFPDLEVFAPPIEDVLIRHPLLEPVYLYGAFPPTELQNKFLMAPPSPALAVAAGPATIGGIELDLIEVPGHALNMYAVRLVEVLYAADALFGPQALDKHPLTFSMDSSRQKDSAARLATLEGVRITLPGHGEPTRDLAALVAANLESYARVTETVRAAALDPASLDAVLARVSAALGLSVSNLGASLLNRSVVSAHLAELLARGEARFDLQDGVARFTTL